MNITEVSQVHKVNTLIRPMYGPPFDIKLVDKITGVNSNDQLNGGYGSAKIDFDEATLYPFQYLTIKPRGYTKHYFIGNEHIATTFGNGGFEKVTQNTERKPETVHESQLMYWFYDMQWGDPYVFLTNTIGETTKNIDYQGLEHSDLQYNCNPTIVADMYASWRPRLHNVIGDNLGVLNRKQESYFYHNDHLGSTKLVMDGYGHICNEIDYMPFGETFHPDRGYLEKHKFTGKERDEETQYDYFGARYYWSAAKHWLSVDPLSDKYPGISPYAYCGWNPINYVAPDGKDAKMIVSGNTITLQATYYVRPTDIQSAMQAVNFWNKQTDLQYTDNKGNTYSVLFDLSIKETGNPHNTANLEGAYANSYEIVQQLSAETSAMGSKAIGLTKDNRSIEVRSDRSNGLTGAHEIGHTLMNVNTKDGEHSASGIMTKSASDPQHGGYVSQETVNTIIESHKSSSLWSRI